MAGTIELTAPEVAGDFATVSLAGVTCDKCGPYVSAAHRIHKDGAELFFCAHDTRELQGSLIEKGYTITPALVAFS